MRFLSALNTYYRLLVLVFGTTALFLILYGSLYFYTAKQEKTVYKATREEYANEVNSIFQLNAKSHNSSNYYVSYWDELVEYTKSKDTTWYNEFIQSEFEAYEVDFLGIYGLDKKLIGSSTTGKIKASNFIPDAAFQSLLKKKVQKFYLRIPEGIAEIYIATIHPTDDPKRTKYPPSGFFVMARLIDQHFTSDLEDISSSRIKIVSKSEPENQNKNLVAVKIDLLDWKNEAIAALYFERAFNLNFSNTKQILNIIIAATLINLLIFLFYFRRWVYTPIKLITNILEKKDQSSIEQLKCSRDEFGHIGKLFEENDKQRQQLLVAKNKAEESDKLKSSFLANLSHEIRTPMNAIMGFSELLSDPNLESQERLKYLSIIKNSGKNLIGIIEDLIEMSKIDSKQVSPNIKPVNFVETFNEIYHTLKITIPDHKSINFELQKPSFPIQNTILTDEIKLKQILTNLLTNAIKFTQKGNIVMGYLVHTDIKYLEIWVTDTGTGIDEEDLKIIFERFRRVENDQTVDISGLGLGLSITKAYTEALGGNIEVKSNIGQGSTFTIRLPLNFAEKDLEPTTKYELSKTSISGSGTILVAEDDDINFMLIERILRSKAYKIIRAINGQEAVDICNENPQIDLIFMDIKMPIMDGFEAFEKIKIINPKIPVIANTAYSSPEDKEQIKTAGFSGYISKPLSKDEIYQILINIFGAN